MHLHKCDHVNLFLLGGGGGGVVRLTAKPRYLLLHHRGKEKSNTVTALIKTQICEINSIAPKKQLKNKILICEISSNYSMVETGMAIYKKKITMIC